MEPKRGQVGPKRVQVGPKRRPRGSKELPKGSPRPLGEHKGHALCRNRCFSYVKPKFLQVWGALGRRLEHIWSPIWQHKSSLETNLTAQVHLGAQLGSTSPPWSPKVVTVGFGSPEAPGRYIVYIYIYIYIYISYIYIYIYIYRIYISYISYIYHIYRIYDIYIYIYISHISYMYVYIR